MKFLLTGCLLMLCSLHRYSSLSCFKCMTTDFVNDTCSDLFNPIYNRFEPECQATIKGRDGLFPARFCVKISGIIVDLDQDLNRSLIHKNLYLRTCITENIMESTRSLESTGNFRLRNFVNIPGEIKIQGTISLCTLDGCNNAHRSVNLYFTMIMVLFFLIIFK